MRTTQTTRCLQLALTAAVLSTTSGLAAQTPQWKPFGTPAEGFQALFPSQPEVSKSDVSAGGDTYGLRSYVVEVGSTALYVGICDYGAQGRAANYDQILMKAEKGAINHIAAHILSEKKITLGASSGVEFEAENDALHVTTRMYIASGVLYQVSVTSPLNEKFADTTRFLDSLQLLDRAGN